MVKLAPPRAGLFCAPEQVWEEAINRDALGLGSQWRLASFLKIHPASVTP
jgi:hypothetical protein